MRVTCEAHSPTDALDVMASRSDDGSTLVLKVVNPSDKPHRATIDISGMADIASNGEATTLKGKLANLNPPEKPENIHSHNSKTGNAGPRFDYEFAAYSYTILKLKRKP